MSRLVSRDPFARTELHSRVYSKEIECSWCGTVRRTFEYWTETDGGRAAEHKGVFCCKSCHDSYHN